MMKNLLISMALGIVAVLPATGFAAVNWDGDAGNGVWADPVNWAGNALPTNADVTEEARIDNGVNPVIADGNATEWDRARIKNATVTQTGGTHRWRNYTSSNGLGLHRGTATLHMTGGTHYAERVVLGGSIFTTSPTAANDGVGIIDIWGDSTFVLEPNTYGDPASDIYQVYHLWILDGGSQIDIRDMGELRVPAEDAMMTQIGDYIDLGKIVAGEPGTSLMTAVDGSQYVVSVVPEPATLVLLGLGGLALVCRRRRD